MKWTFSLVLFLIGLAACSQSSAAGNAADGARWYAMHRCNGCHGAEGAGGRGPAIRSPQLDFAAFKKKVRNSGSAIMPSYSQEKLSDQDLVDMHAFLTKP